MENFTLLQCRIFREAIPWFIRSLCALFNLIPSISMVSCYELVLYYFHSQFEKSVKAANWMLKRQGWRNLLQYILLLPISYYSYSDTKSHRIAWSVDSKSEDWQNIPCHDIFLDNKSCYLRILIRQLNDLKIHTDCVRQNLLEY